MYPRLSNVGFTLSVVDLNVHGQGPLHVTRKRVSVSQRVQGDPFARTMTGPAVQAERMQRMVVRVAERLLPFAQTARFMWVLA